MVRFIKSRFELVVEQNQIRCEMGVETVDESWKFTDAAGHPHSWVAGDGYPTLRYVVDAQHWCDGDEGWGRHDPHMCVDEAHYECKRCGEVINPGRHPAGHVTFVPGPMSATLTGLRSDGYRVVVRLLEEEFEELRACECAEDVAQRVLDAVPQDRVISWSREVL